MDETLFYVFGIALVVSAIGISAIGLRFERFPPTGTVLAAIIVYFAGMVAATTTFAVLNARDQAHSREAKEAAAQPSAGTTTTSATTTTTTAAPGGGTVLKLAANPTQIAYDTKALSAKAGTVTVDFTNPSAVTHDVCLTGSSGQQIGCSQTISQGSTSLSQQLKPGKYTFFCSVDGHEAAGMKGTLTVK